MVHLISFTFETKGDAKERRDRLEVAIKTYPWARISPWVWIVSVPFGAATLRDELWQHMSEGDKLFVTRLASEWGSYNLSADIVQWLNTVKYE